MSELERLKEMRSSVPPPSNDSLRTMRVRMLGGARPSARMPRLMWKAGAAGALGLALFVGLTLVPGSETKLPNGTTVRAGQPASAAVVLNKAALAAQQRPAMEKPRDDQFIYKKELRKGFDPRVDVETAESWTQFHYDKRSDKDNRSPKDIWNYNESLPTDPDAMLEEIYREVKRIYSSDLPDAIRGDGLHERAFWLGTTMLGADDGLPAQPDRQAAVYRAIAKIPGVKVKAGVRDLAGREGIMIYRKSAGTGSYGLIVSSSTYEFLGAEHFGLPGPNGKEHELQTTLLEKKVVGEDGTPGEYDFQGRLER